MLLLLLLLAPKEVDGRFPIFGPTPIIPPFPTPLMIGGGKSIFSLRIFLALGIPKLAQELSVFSSSDSSSSKTALGIMSCRDRARSKAACSSGVKIGGGGDEGGGDAAPLGYPYPSPPWMVGSPYKGPLLLVLLASLS